MPEDGFAPQSYDTDHHWDPQGRPPWQRHSELGPNLDPEARRTLPEAMQELVNPVDYDWHAPAQRFAVAQLRTWQTMLESETSHATTDKTADSLNDDLQRLFVSLLLEHVEDFARCWRTGEQPQPLYLFLLGTAGTGKTTATQTMLQEVLAKLPELGLVRQLIRVAAPTGSAAFNVGFNATTVHRLIKWFNPRLFQELEDPEKLMDLQAYLEHTQILVFDEASMLGRKMMGRIASRMDQAAATENPRWEICGGFSLVCIGDPAQCLSLIHI